MARAEMDSRLIRSSAPVRLDFAGGWTDVPPFSAREGGVVVNAAIGLRADASVRLGGRTMRLVSEDLGKSVELESPAQLASDGELDLLKAGLRMFPVGPCVLTTRCDAPPGCGLGSSGAMDVALVAALARARGEELDPHDLAEQAWHLETFELGNAGGKQDQYAAALGGFNRMTFRDPEVETIPLRLEPAFAEALERATVLCYTGTSRISGRTISRVQQAYERGDPAVVGALRTMRDVAYAMAEALCASDLARVGELLSENWRRQQELDPGMRTEGMARLEEAMRDAGALGGKAAGAGAGGSMFFIVPDARERAEAAAREAGTTVLPVAWSGDGVRVW